MITKKICFIVVFLSFLFGANAQKVDKQRGNTDKVYYVKIETTYGDIVVKLYNETPKHRDNFLKLVKEGTYDGVLFHRVIQNFMIQGGDPNSRNAKKGEMLGNGELGYTLPAEFVPSLYHKKGALAAARQADQVNPQKMSSGCRETKTCGDQHGQEFHQRTGRSVLHIGWYTIFGR